MISLIAGVSFLINEDIVAIIWQTKGVTMFLEHCTSVKMDLSVFNIRVNVRVIEFPLSNWSMV